MSGSQWSHAGVVVLLPNAHTGSTFKRKLFPRPAAHWFLTSTAERELALFEVTAECRLGGRRGNRGGGVRLLPIDGKTTQKQGDRNCSR